MLNWLNNHFNLHIVDEIISFFTIYAICSIEKECLPLRCFKVVRTHIIRLIDPNMLNIPDISSTS